MIRFIIQQSILALFRLYQLFLSPILHGLGGPGSGCRFYPSCSVYAIEAVRDHGPIRGLWLTLRRVLRCNPWGGRGADPVPQVDHCSDVLDNRIRK